MKKRISLLLTISIVLLSGCQNINLTSDEEDLVAEYAANSVLQRSYSYDKVLVDMSQTEESTGETKASNTNMEETKANTVDETNSKTANSTNKTQSSIKETLDLNDFVVSYNGYQLSNSYPDPVTEDSVFAMNAEEGSKILIVNFNVTNQSNKIINLDMQSREMDYYLSINNNAEFNAKFAILQDTLNTFSGEFAVNETKQLLLIFQVPDKYSVNINSLNLETDNGSNQYVTSLQ